MKTPDFRMGDSAVQISKEPCEICGSVGIADLLMICFKCRETREHTYCARVLLPSVPPMWICEVCRFSSRMLLSPDAAENLMDSETNVAVCTSNPKNSGNSREDNHETAKLSTNVMEETLETGVSLPVILQASTDDSNYKISANVSSVIHPPSHPHTSPVAKEAFSEFNDTSQGKEEHQLSQAFPKKPKNIRVMGKHVSQSHQTLISSLDQSLT